MKIILSSLRVVLAIGLATVSAQEPNPAKKELSSLQKEEQEIVQKVREKLKSGQRSEQDLAAELGAFDALVAKHAEEKTDEVAHVLIMQSSLYFQVLENPGKAVGILEKIKSTFPAGSNPVAQADRMLTGIKSAEAAMKIQAGLKPGVVFPNFSVTDLDGKPLSVENFKGKILLIDFWATWCGPCVAELPNVLATYEKYHAKGFEVIGVSLDKDKATLTAFLAGKKVPWPQYFDGLGWQNKLAAQYGINSIPATYLLDRNGQIIAKGLRGEALETAVEKALSAQ